MWHLSSVFYAFASKSSILQTLLALESFWLIKDHKGRETTWERVYMCLFVYRMRCQPSSQVCVVLTAFLVQPPALPSETLIIAPSMAACCTSRERAHTSWHRTVRADTSGERAPPWFFICVHGLCNSYIFFWNTWCSYLFLQSTQNSICQEGK